MATTARLAAARRGVKSRSRHFAEKMLKNFFQILGWAA